MYIHIYKQMHSHPNLCGAIAGVSAIYLWANSTQLRTSRKGDGTLVEDRTPLISPMRDRGSREVERLARSPTQERYEGEDEDFDAEFYGDENDLTRSFIGDEEKFREHEERMANAKAGRVRGAKKKKGESARRSALNDDQNAWEENRLLTSGVAHRARVDTDFDSELDQRVQLQVRNVRPKFLDGRVSFSKQMVRRDNIGGTVLRWMLVCMCGQMDVWSSARNTKVSADLTIALVPTRPLPLPPFHHRSDDGVDSQRSDL